MDLSSHIFAEMNINASLDVHSGRQVYCHSFKPGKVPHRPAPSLLRNVCFGNFHGHSEFSSSRSKYCTQAIGTENAQDPGPSREPQDVRGAIAVGLQLYEDQKYQEALQVFEKALNLPGTGLKRFRDKPRLISDGEKQSVLYNIACCYSRLEDARTGLVALAGCLETGYDDVNQLRGDPDLAFLRKDNRFDGLLTRFNLNNQKGGFFGSLLKGFNI